MAMIVDALVSQFKDTLTTMAKDELTLLLGAKEALQQLKEEVRDFSDVLRDAEHRAFTETTVSNWLAVVKDFVYDADDIIDYSRTQAEKLARFPSGHPVRCYSILLSFFLKVRLRHQMGSRIRTINERLHSVRKKGSDLQLIAAVAPRDDRGGSSSRIQRDTGSRVEPDIVGTDIEHDTTHLVGLLTRDHVVGGPRIQVLAIAGMGGVGKSTLAQKIFNHQAIKDNNFRPLIWVCVSQEYNQTKLMKEIIRSAGADPERLQSFAELQGLLAGVLDGKKFFLVLDDVWDAQVWEKLLQNPLQSGAPGSRVLITTRNESVAKQIGATDTHTVNPLSPEDSWSLFCKMVFRDGEGGVETVGDIGVQIVQRCQGLPLAIKATAGVLRTKAKTRGEWEMVLKRQAWSSNKLPDEVMGVLYLSYEDLPHHLKQCFIFCSLFPEDHVFMRHTLIQHWVAEGFIKDEEDPIMEEVARDYYKELLTRSLLQPDPRYYDNGGCKMHDLLRSLAQFLSRDENFVGDLTRLVNPATSSSSSVKLRHLTIVDAELGKVSQVVKEYESLRTLLLIGNPFSFMTEDDDASEVPESVTDDLFKKLGCLRVLDLSYTNLITLSKSVGNLIHLRYLDLSFSSMVELPDSVEKLSNLQYLILQSCENLNKLPKGIAKLYKLRSLDLLNTPVDGLPAGIGRLKHLNRLMGFMTNEDMGGGGWCSLEEIRSLSQLRTLTIDGIERALIRRRPRGLLLNDKCHIRHLELCCGPNITEGQLVGEEDQTKILEIFEEELVPPPSVEKFDIKGFFGLQFPSWLMTSTAVFLLSNLRRLDLKKCMFCKQLPPLGQLPNLDLLNIRKAYAVEIIGPEFMGVGGRGPRMPQPIAFPKLETLKLEDMPNLMEWQWEAEDGVAAMPRLDVLKIIDCPSLRFLPAGLRSVATLTTLIIEGAVSLKVIENFVSLKVLVLSGNHSLVRVSNLPALQNLVVNSCMVLSDVGGLNSPQRLQLQDFAMESLPDWLLLKEGKPAFPMLERLQILVGDARVLYRCLVDAPDWPKIQHFPLVQIQSSSEPAFVLYNKATDILTTNLNIGGSATADHDN